MKHNSSRVVPNVAPANSIPTRPGFKAGWKPMTIALNRSSSVYKRKDLTAVIPSSRPMYDRYVPVTGRPF
jgi:hypothetical protein